MQKPLTELTTANYGKLLKKWECLTTLYISWEIHMWDRNQQLELDMEQLIRSNLGKEYDKAVYCLPAYESETGIKIAGRNINNLRYADDTTLMAESEEEYDLIRT